MAGLSTLESSLPDGVVCKVGLFRFIVDRLTVEQQYRRGNLGPHGDPPHAHESTRPWGGWVYGYSERSGSRPTKLREIRMHPLSPHCCGIHPAGTRTDRAESAIRHHEANRIAITRRGNADLSLESECAPVV